MPPLLNIIILFFFLHLIKIAQAVETGSFSRSLSRVGLLDTRKSSKSASSVPAGEHYTAGQFVETQKSIRHDDAFLRCALLRARNLQG